MPKADPMVQLESAARIAVDQAKLYPQDGGIVVLLKHTDYLRLASALEDIPRKRSRTIVYRGPSRDNANRVAGPAQA